MPDLDITFVVPGLRATGGIRAVFEVADRLGARGHRTLIVVPERSLLASRRSPAGLIQRLGPRWLAPVGQRLSPRRPMRQDWFALKTPIRVAGLHLQEALPGAGMVVTTAYRTAEALLDWPGLAKRGVSFAQGYEIWDGPAARVDRTWRAFDRTIVTSPNLESLARGRFGRTDVVRAPYGVDLARFTLGSGREHADDVVIGFHHDDRRFKGSAAIVEAIAMLRADGVPVTGRCFGLGSSSLPSWVESLGPLASDGLPAFYRSVDLFVSASRDESGPMTLPEAMACGVAVASTEVGCVGLWSPPDASPEAIRIIPTPEPTAIAAAIRPLLDASAAGRLARDGLASAGHRAIQSFDWEPMVDVIEQALVRWGATA